jgi:hypothetical protein
MNDPRDDLSYEATINLSFNIDDLDFYSTQKFEFEVPVYSERSHTQLEATAREAFMEKYSEYFDGLEIDINVKSIKKM